jgi:ubiquinone/menaquinone biosynthesis C-methylase UbiE
MLDSKFWAKYFKVYDVLNLLIPYQELLETICDELEIKPGEKILEAGCGTGNLAIKIKERGGDVIGLDNCKEALEIYKKKDPDAKVVLADLRKKLPFPDNYFDKIACNNTLYIIPKEKQIDTLKEFYRVLKAGGKIVLTNPIKGAKPIKIYFNGIKKDLQRNGWIKTVKDITLMAIPTIKILYYNRLILKEGERESYKFFDLNEQRELLEKTGFVSSSQTKLVYEGQAILDSGIKLT